MALPHAGVARGWPAAPHARQAARRNRPSPPTACPSGRRGCHGDVPRATPGSTSGGVFSPSHGPSRGCIALKRTNTLYPGAITARTVADQCPGRPDRVAASRRRRARGRGDTVTNDTLRVRVASITREAEDILSYELVAEDGGALPGFEAGAHLQVQRAGAGRLRALVLALQRPGRDAPLRHRRAPRRQGARWLARHARARPRGRRARSGRARQQLPPALRAQLRAHRGRHRHHPAAVHGARAGAHRRGVVLHYCSRSASGTAFTELLSSPRPSPAACTSTMTGETPRRAWT